MRWLASFSKTNASFDFIPNACPKGFLLMENKMREKLVVLASLQREVKRPQRIFRAIVNLGDRIIRLHASIHDKALENGPSEYLEGRFRLFVGRNSHSASSRPLTAESTAHTEARS